MQMAICRPEHTPPSLTPLFTEPFLTLFPSPLALPVSPSPCLKRALTEPPPASLPGLSCSLGRGRRETGWNRLEPAACGTARTRLLLTGLPAEPAGGAGAGVRSGSVLEGVTVGVLPVRCGAAQGLPELGLTELLRRWWVSGTAGSCFVCHSVPLLCLLDSSTFVLLS